MGGIWGVVWYIVYVSVCVWVCVCVRVGLCECVCECGCVCVCMCVWHICTDVKLLLIYIYKRGVTGVPGRWCPCVHICTDVKLLLIYIYKRGVTGVPGRSTDLNSEFTHFNLVIRLSKVQQSAFRFCTFFQESRCSCGPMRTLRDAFFPGMPYWTTTNLRFCSNLCSYTTSSRHCGQAHDLHLLMVVGEVKHVVHLIRWNLFMPLQNWWHTTTSRF